MSHRAVIAAALANGRSRIDNLVYSQDIEATCDAVAAFGCSVRRLPDAAEIDGRAPLASPAVPIRCRESGSTLRFLIPFAGLVDGETVFLGEGELVRRPLGPYFDLFDRQGIRYRYDGSLPLTVAGRLKPDTFELPGNVSSQFVTGLLFVLPLLDGDSVVAPTSSLESEDYVRMTLQVMRDFGVVAESTENGGYRVPGNQRYRPTDYRVEGDYSQAAFWIAAGLMGEGLTLRDLRRDTIQGDARILDIAAAMGGNVRWEGDSLKVSGTRTRGAVVDASQCPDIVPILAVLAAVSEGTTRIVNAGRLRIKESDRLKAMATELNKLGARVTEEPEGLTIEGVRRLAGGVVDGWNDHRIVMSLAAAAIKCDSPVTIVGSEAVRKSYPHFFEDFRSLGGAVR
jgi:3-phosphoshikimate 1-carboxyvinyltransferase